MDLYLKYTENNKIEAKKAKDKLPDSVFDTYSAFANTDGGVILLGVSEDKNKRLIITGVNDSAKILDDFWNNINNKQKVSINILNNNNVKVITESGREYIEISVPRADNSARPIYLNDNPKKAYKRNYSGDYQCTEEEIRAMIRDQVDNLDSKVLDDFSIDDIDMESVRKYRNIFKQLKENHIWNSIEELEFLEKIRAIQIKNGVCKLTIAGLLFFGYDYKISLLYPNYFLDYQEIMTIDPSIRYTNRIYSGTGDWSGNIFDFYFRVVGRLLLDIELPFKLQENSIHRISETNMHRAVGEGLANCLVNADFTFARGLVIKKTYTEIVFENPGSLRLSIEQAFKGGVSDPRNANILHMFSLINVGEKAGSGIPTIKKAFEDANFLKPVLYDESNPNRTFLKLSFVKETKIDVNIESKVSVGVDFESYTFTEQESQIVSYLKTNNHITRKKVEIILGVKQNRANEILKSLIENHIIERVGESRAIRYILK